MKKFLVFLFLILVVIFLFSFKNLLEIYSLWGKDFAVLIVYNPNFLKEHSYIMNAYRSVLEEEGVIYKEVSIFNLITFDPKIVADFKKIIIFPNGLNQYLPKEAGPWVRNYLSYGGNIFVSYDAGIKDFKNEYLEKALFSEFVGANYITYKKYKVSFFTLGYLYIDKTRKEFLEIPDGKLEKENLLGGYAYGNLECPIVRVEEKKDIKENEIYALTISQDGKNILEL
ncbi:MAG: hypothetical protein ACPLVD_00415 [Dictyoglomus turgidum]|uniref:hypothetical protein n=1 Tax=Dictyoglomus turgidum TaxID=513050 RepID=UPI003C726D03